MTDLYSPAALVRVVSAEDIQKQLKPCSLIYSLPVR